MRVVDTSAWIEWLLDSPAGRALRREVPPPDRLVVPTIVQLELAKWLAREAPDQEEIVIGYTRECVVAPLSTDVALRAAELGREHKLATADSIVYATAVVAGIDLVTCDAHFKDLRGVRYHPPKAP